VLLNDIINCKIMFSDIKNIGIIGSGNVAYHLSKSFQDKLLDKNLFIYSRNIIEAKEIAVKFKINFIEDLTSFIDKCDLIIIAITDDAIESLVNKIPLGNKIIAHTSGVKSMHQLKPVSKNYGSFYPLQTFTKTRDVDFNKVPILIDASNLSTKEVLLSLANLLSNKVKEVKDEDRALIHPAAVMVNNFTNHLFSLAKDYAESKNLDFDILHALIEETALKAISQNPKEIQTGPAVRKDKNTIEQHLKMLKEPNLKELYMMFTESIEKYYE